MTPSQELGYKVKDKFKVTGNISDHQFPIGEIVSLKEDDGSTIPGFVDDKGNAWYLDIYAEVEPLAEPAVKPKDGLRIQVKKVKGGFILDVDHELSIHTTATEIGNHLRSLIGGLSID